VTHLRKRVLEELERRNYTESTTRAYLRTISDFAEYFHQSPEHLGPEHIREYIAYLFRERKLSDNTVNQRVGVLRFFYVKNVKTLKRRSGSCGWNKGTNATAKAQAPASSKERRRRLQNIKRLINHIRNERLQELESFVVRLAAPPEIAGDPQAKSLAEKLRRLWEKE
jgi:hypothetical protein